jgi:hypothetical protein
MIALGSEFSIALHSERLLFFAIYYLIVAVSQTGQYFGTSS